MQRDPFLCSRKHKLRQTSASLLRLSVKYCPEGKDRLEAVQHIIVASPARPDGQRKSAAFSVRS